MQSAVKVFLLFITVVLIITGLSVYWTIFKLVPSPDKTVRIHGLNSEVTVHWDGDMVPHIIAENETDAFTVTGYIHARDRLWQMTRYQYKLEALHSREIDESLLDLDVFYLTLPFSENAREAFEMLDNYERQLLIAYADGINSYVEQNRKNLPIEFTLSDARPVKWEPWHTLGVQLLWGWQHQQAFWSKLALTPVHEIRDDTLTRALTGGNVPHSALFGNYAPLVEPSVHKSLLSDFLTFTRFVIPGQAIRPGTGFAISSPSPGSINLVSETRESPLSIPGQGYEMAVTIGNTRRSGITVPGFPVLLSGRNDHLAWAIQPTAVDDGDFYFGRIFVSPMTPPVDWKHDASVYENLSGHITLDRHILEMKNGAEYQVITRKSHGRPVVAVSETDNSYLAFEWAGFSPPVDFGSYLELTYAETVSDLEATVREIGFPAIQVLGADRNGASGRWFGGYTLNRTHPLKLRNHNDQSGRSRVSSLLPSQTGSAGDPVFFLESRPSEIPPDRYSSLYFSPWDRSLRFRELMDQTSPDHLVADITEVWDNDTYSTFASTLTPEIIRALGVETVPEPNTEQDITMEPDFEMNSQTDTNEVPDESSDAYMVNQTDREAFNPDPLIDITLPYLQNWNYEFKSNETAATIFESFLIKASENLYKPLIGEEELRLLFVTPQVPMSAVSRLIQNPEQWPESHPMTYRDWIAQSIIEATSDLIKRYGEEPFDWQWGNVVQGDFLSPLFQHTIAHNRAANLADRNLFRPGDPGVTGSPHTIHSSSYNFNAPFTLASATTLKRVMVLSPDEKIHSILSTGQSGNIFSDHFDDQFYYWKYGNKKVRVFGPATDLNVKHTQQYLPVTPGNRNSNE